MITCKNCGEKFVPRDGSKTVPCIYCGFLIEVPSLGEESKVTRRLIARESLQSKDEIRREIKVLKDKKAYLNTTVNPYSFFKPAAAGVGIFIVCWLFLCIVIGLNILYCFLPLVFVICMFVVNGISFLKKYSDFNLVDNKDFITEDGKKDIKEELVEIDVRLEELKRKLYDADSGQPGL